ncbi:hypothetical protein CH379_010810 [Leptospira ellisii]|uniref:Uncharacterized protein n=1 Tax=Leptospira ellisii TaxID=2023197 RepID=A0A2N0B757_9LEPT|nr:hypothetical protein [Leptospira ellisii]MDV6236113.1 hypothetical protein [Leptospira ellisii]PJZ92356.1 hypothetical protein CH379_13585 [Leptospira ellisii]PKA03870.1 hypothetical protein CH375_14400 [Leptospira ellisii]
MQKSLFVIFLFFQFCASPKYVLREHNKDKDKSVGFGIYLLSELKFIESYTSYRFFPVLPSKTVLTKHCKNESGSGHKPCGTIRLSENNVQLIEKKEGAPTYAVDVLLLTHWFFTYPSYYVVTGIEKEVEFLTIETTGIFRTQTGRASSSVDLKIVDPMKTVIPVDASEKIGFGGIVCVRERDVISYELNQTLKNATVESGIPWLQKEGDWTIKRIFFWGKSADEENAKKHMFELLEANR